MEERSDMAVFVAVMKEGSFAAASKALQMTPSGVSRRISTLEGRLGVRLLNRTTRRLSLTESGEVYYRRSAQIIADIKETEQETSQLRAAPRGRLRVTAPNAFGNVQLIRIIPEFLRAYPEISVELTLIDRVVDIVGEGFDVAIRSGALDDASTISRRLTTTRHVICAAPQYLEAHGEPQTPDELAQHNCLVRQFDHSDLNDWHFEMETGHKTIRVHGNFTANSNETLFRAALSGAGILRATTFFAQDAIDDGRLIPLLESYSIESERPIYALFPSNKYLPLKTRAFIDFLILHL